MTSPQSLDTFGRRLRTYVAEGLVVVTGLAGFALHGEPVPGDAGQTYRATRPVLCAPFQNHYPDRPHQHFDSFSHQQQGVTAVASSRTVGSDFSHVFSVTTS